MSVSLKHLLNDVIKKYGLEKAMLNEQLPRIWTDMVSPRIASITEVRSFEQGILRVHVKDAVWRAELVLRRDELKNQLNTVIGQPVVNEIIFR